MPDKAREQLQIHASVQRVFDVLTDFERYPEWAPDLKAARVLERDQDGRGLLVEFRAAAMGRSTTYQLRYDYSGAPHRLAWVLETGDVTRELDGAYHLESESDDSTEVTYDLSVDLTVPIPGFVKRRAEARILKTALPELKARIESLLH
ncbi:MAG: SRPBCC family protein [Acidimicrobiales bacterium]|nr:SRPBCC family protein [Acidimicrobiales bacterium]